MSPKPDLLDRIALLVPRPEHPLDDFHRLLRRRRRNERIRAGVLAITIVVVGTLVAVNAFRRRIRPAS